VDVLTAFHERSLATQLSSMLNMFVITNVYARKLNVSVDVPEAVVTRLGYSGLGQSVTKSIQGGLEYLEYSGISLNMENSGNSVQPRGKIVTNKVFLIRHSNICVKQPLTG